MRWEDMTRKFREELDAAIFRKVILGDTQPIVDIIDKVMKESFSEGCRYMLDLSQDIITKEVTDHE